MSKVCRPKWTCPIKGDHDKNDGWFEPDDSQFMKMKNGIYPSEAYKPLKADFCGDECDDLVLPRKIPTCFEPSLDKGYKSIYGFAIKINI